MRATPGAARARCLASAAAAALALCACKPYVQGNGVFLEEDRSGAVGPFVGIHLEDGIQATVTVTPAAPPSVLVSGDANVVQYVHTEVREETVPGLGPIKVLHVSVAVDDFDPAIPVGAVLKAPEIRYVSASDSRHAVSKVDLRDAATESLVVEARNDAEVLVAGPGGAALVATLDDAALDAGSYVVQTAQVTLTSRSRVELHANAEVKGSAQGDSVVDNLLGAGICDIDVPPGDTSRVSCQPPPP